MKYNYTIYAEGDIEETTIVSALEAVGLKEIFVESCITQMKFLLTKINLMTKIFILNGSESRNRESFPQAK